MAGKNSIQILRGTKDKLSSHASDTLLDGQPLYDKTNNWLCIGNGGKIEARQSVSMDFSLDALTQEEVEAIWGSNSGETGSGSGETGSGSGVLTGGVKVDDKYGITVVDSGADKGKLILYGATADDINNRSTYFRPITPGNLDLAVKASLVDNNSKIEFNSTEQERIKNKIGIPSIIDNGKQTIYPAALPFFGINFGVKNEILKRFFLDTLLIGNTHYGSGYIQKANNAKLFLPDIINDSTIATYLQLINRFRIDYFDLGDGTTYRKSQIKLVPNSILVITENSGYRASAVGMVNNNGTLSKTDILPHEKTSSVSGKYYDIATTAFIVTGYENQLYAESAKYCQVVRITIDGLNTKIKFFSVKEKDGVVLTVSMKSSGTHRECIALGVNINE